MSLYVTNQEIVAACWTILISSVIDPTRNIVISLCKAKIKYFCLNYHDSSYNIFKRSTKQKTLKTNRKLSFLCRFTRNLGAVLMPIQL